MTNRRDREIRRVVFEIRPQQVRACGEAGLADYEARMLQHVREFSPKHAAILEDATLRRLVHAGMAKADQYGMPTERNCRCYTELMLVLGSGFDEDPLIPWAAELLRGGVVGPEDDRMNALCDKAWDYIHHIARDYAMSEGGPDPRRFISEITRLRRESPRPLVQAEREPLFFRMSERLQAIFPHKCSYVGLANLDRAMQRALETAHDHDIHSERGVALFIVMSFILGAGFAADPQLPWVGRILAEPDTGDATARVDQLLQGAVDCMRRWWEPRP